MGLGCGESFLDWGGGGGGHHVTWWLPEVGASYLVSIVCSYFWEKQPETPRPLDP